MSERATRMVGLRWVPERRKGTPHAQRRRKRKPNCALCLSKDGTGERPVRRTRRCRRKSTRAVVRHSPSGEPRSRPNCRLVVVELQIGLRLERDEEVEGKVPVG